MPSINHPIVGTVRYEVLSGGRLKILSAQHIATAFIPQLKGVPTYGGLKFSGNVPFYGDAIPQLKAAFEMVEELGLENKIVFWAGSYVPRLKRGGSTPSNHSFGTAFDINSVQNPFKKKPAPKGVYGSVIELLPIFRELGFECGADWKNTPDGMHFEIKRILNALEIGAAKGRIDKIYDKSATVVAAESKPAPAKLREDLLVWNGVEKMPVVMVQGIPYVPVRSMIEAGGHTIIKTNNQIEETGRFYVNSTPKGSK